MKRKRHNNKKHSSTDIKVKTNFTKAQRLRSPKLLVLYVLLFVAAGFMIIHSNASSSDSARFEAESGSLSGPAVTGSDAAASGGSYVRLNTTSSTFSASKSLWSSPNYVGWAQGDPTTLPWQNITALLHFSVMTTAGSAIDTTGHSLTPAKMTAAVNAAHAQNKKILLAVGGAEDNTWNTACNSTNRAAFINNLINLVTTYGYDGVDLDIEQDWGAPAHTDYIACVSGIRTALNAITPRPFLTEDADADWQSSMLTQTWRYIDQIHIMAFSHSALTQAEANALKAELDSYTNLGIPASMLNIGIGLEPGLPDSTANAQPCTEKANYALGTNAFNPAHTVYGGTMVWTIQDDPSIHGGNYSCMSAIGTNLANTGATTCNFTPPSGGGVATFNNVTLPAGGTYNLFTRMMVPTLGNSFYLQIDNACPYQVRDSSAVNTWDWVPLPGGLNHTAGASHTVRLYGSDPSVKVDELLFSQSCTPTGNGDNCLSGPGDTQPPTVSLTAPSNGATVSGSSVSVAANASDNVGVAGVQFKLDGANLGAEDTTSTYGITWDTTAASNGSHALTATARDAAGNTATSASINVTVSNSGGSCPNGDVNGDCHVTITDLSILLSNWNSTTNATCDLNGNGVVDIFDLSILLSHYGQ
jgi:chitinase